MACCRSTFPKLWANFDEEGVGGDKNITMRVTGSPAHTIIAFSYLLIIMYALTLAPICWVYAAEVWSLETRATGMGIAAIGNWLFNFAIGLFIPPAFINIRWKLFIVFGVLCLGGAAQFYLTYPEVTFPNFHAVQRPLTNLVRHAARLLKKLRSCLAPTDRNHGRQRREIQGSNRRLRQ